MKILFICSRNWRRSLTAEKLFAGTPGWQVRSAGTSDSARIRVTAGHVGWADVVVVMEKRHRERLESRFRDLLQARPVHCLFIPDEYEFMDPALVALLRTRLADVLPNPCPKNSLTSSTTGTK